MRVSIWITACNSALSIPGGVKDAQGVSLPTSIGGAQSASKYMSKAFASLRAGTSDETTLGAISTLEKLLKLWIKQVREESLDLIKKQKISWGLVLRQGSQTETKKIKGKDVTQIVNAVKPSRSPWLSNKERQALSKLYSEAWSAPEVMRKAWVELPSQDQHANYHQVIAALKKHNEKLNQVSSNIHAKLGHRKKWIYAAVKEKDAEPKSKKDKSNPFAWSAEFFKLNTQDIRWNVASIFSPSHYLPTEDAKENDIYSQFYDVDANVTGAELARPEGMDSNVYELWKEWADRFAPNFDQIRFRKTRAEQVSFSDENPFAVLGLLRVDQVD